MDLSQETLVITLVNSCTCLLYYVGLVCENNGGRDKCPFANNAVYQKNIVFMQVYVFTCTCVNVSINSGYHSY